MRGFFETMKESTFWEHLKPELKRLGKLQKISDRFTPGVPDVLGSIMGIPVAMELKEFDGVRVMRVSFRPGQVDWLEDWQKARGVSLILSTQGQTAYVHGVEDAQLLEDGMTPQEVLKLSLLTFRKTRQNTWREFTIKLLYLIKSRHQ